jgi:hypothetical protein
MLGRIRDKGPILLCDVCQQPMTDQAARVLWEIDGPPTQSVWVIHDRCEASEMVRFFLKQRYRQMRLGAYLEQILEGISVSMTPP